MADKFSTFYDVGSIAGWCLILQIKVRSYYRDTVKLLRNIT